jgi:hypothetical protein
MKPRSAPVGNASAGRAALSGILPEKPHRRSRCGSMKRTPYSRRTVRTSLFGWGKRWTLILTDGQRMEQRSITLTKEGEEGLSLANEIRWQRYRAKHEHDPGWYERHREQQRRYMERRNEAELRERWRISRLTAKRRKEKIDTPDEIGPPLPWTYEERSLIPSTWAALEEYLRKFCGPREHSRFVGY